MPLNGYERAEALLSAAQPGWVDELMAVAAIPAPTLDEGERAAYVRRRLEELSGVTPAVDAAGNVVAAFAGAEPGPTVVLAAHLDTVFGRDVHRPPRREGALLLGTGVWDNSAGITALLVLARLLREGSPVLRGRVELAFTVGEEGLGDLKGMRELMRRSPAPDLVIVVDGALGTAVTTGVASVRYEVEVETAGGHAWSDFGSESAVHIAARCVADLTALALPAEPKCTLNVGTIAGGIAVNAIAPFCRFTLDLRSESPQALQELQGQVSALIEKLRAATRGRIGVRKVGERPGGSLPESHPLREWVRRVHRRLGLKTRFRAASTDGNIPLSLGIPAVTVGVGRGANAHRPEESFELDSFPVGVKQLLLLLEEVWREWKPSGGGAL